MSDKNISDMGSYITGFTLTERTNMPELSFKAYIQLVEPLCKEVEHQTGINYVVPLIQSAHESRAGNSGLAKEYGNLFGFKATASWKKNGNAVARMPTWEVITTKNKDNYFAPFEGNKELPKDSDYWKIPEVLEKWVEKDNNQTMYRLKIYVYQEFRIYPTWRDSLFDWGRLISTVKVYADAYPLLKNKDTIKDGIRKMATTYATDINYARALTILYEKVMAGTI